MILVNALILFALFFLICFLGTGGNEKNIRSYDSYPDKIKAMVQLRPSLAAKVKPVNRWVSFFSNLVTFTLVLFVFGLNLRTGSFWHNFLALTALGQGLNLFDLLVIDLCWWRNSPRVRFEDIQADPELYRDPKNHVYAFLRAVPMFFLAAALGGLLLTLF